MAVNKAQDWGYQGAADVRGFGSQVPNPGGWTDVGITNIFRAGQDYEEAEAEAIDRGNFVAADELVSKGDAYAFTVPGDSSWFARVMGWRGAASGFIDSLRVRETELQEAAATDDRAYMTSQELDPEDRKAAEKENELTATLMAKKEAGATDAELQAEYNGIPAVLAPFTSPEALKASVNQGVSAVAGALGRPAAIAAAVLALVAAVYVARRFA